MVEKYKQPPHWFSLRVAVEIAGSLLACRPANPAAPTAVLLDRVIGHLNLWLDQRSKNRLVYAPGSFTQSSDAELPFFFV